MATLKPIQPSVCSDRKIWSEICAKAASAPNPAQIEKLRKDSEKFKKVVKK